jgi:hypothetical protein
MRTVIAIFTLAAVALLFASGYNNAGEKKDTVLKGKITCNKCDLGKSSDCETVIVVKEKVKDETKEVVYFFDKKSDKKYHGAICTESKNGTVTGTVKDEDKKKVINVKKVEYDK